MRIVVTGGTGSLGRALLRRIAAEGKPKVGVMYSRDELKQAQAYESLGRPDNVRPCLGDVRDIGRLRVALHGADVVIHAAALKRVDAVASHADETVKTNIQGTINVCQAAMDCEVGRVLLISSDKAVLPTNSYGASKQMAEWVATGFNSYSVPRGTRIAAIRYGNVLGSRGSVVHIWRKALREGQPLPITNPDATRFIITMDQALECIGEALEQMQGGEIFVPRLPWCYVKDIGLALGGTDFVTVGLRPGGEKLHEQLLSDDERGRCSETARSYVVLPHARSWGWEREWIPAASMTIPAYISGGQRIPRKYTLEEILAEIPEDGAF
jgi:UDP-N-acetylglucosamine 4,6-dehydratase/5-epimerase